MTTPIRIVAVSNLGAIAYIYRTKGGSFHCALADGTPASFSYAGIGPDEMACRFALDDCSTGEQALDIVRQHASALYSYELLPPAEQPTTGKLAALRTLETEVQRLKALLPAVAQLVDNRAVDLARATLAGHSSSSATATEPAKALYVRLFHGRRDPAENLEDRGTDGPVIGPLEFVHTTYMCDVKFAATPDVMDRFFPAVMADWRARKVSNFHGPLCDWQFNIVDDLIEYDGVFYGDWTVFLADPAEIATQMATPAGDG